MPVNRLEKLLEYIKNEPRDEFLQYALATEYLRLNQTDKALEYFETLLQNHPDYVGTYYHLGKLYEALNRLPDAIKTYELGMQVAQKLRDNHSLSELKAVYMEATGAEEDDDY
jgi:tetratricopeptide (TPR) repeat protein